MLVSKFKFKDEYLEIHQEEYAEDFNPRNNDNMGTMVCSHKRYELGDVQVNTEEEYKEAIKDAKITLPVYMYDHSGITISTKRVYPYDDQWDAGQVGVIIVSEVKLKKEYSVKRITKSIIDKATNRLLAEINEYDLFLRGEIYNYHTYKLKKCNMNDYHKTDEDSCGGFIGYNFTENGLFEYTGHTEKEWQKIEV